MQPMDARVLPNGNVVIAYNNWQRDRVAFAVYDSDWNLISEEEFAPFRTRLAGPEDLAMSVTSGSVLAGGPVENAPAYYPAGHIILSMTDITCTQPVAGGYIDLGAGSAAASTTLGDRHFVVKQNGAALSGYFIDDAGTVSAPIDICNGSGPKITSFGDTAVLVYTGVDQETGQTSSYGRIVDFNGLVGEEIRLNDPDAANDNSVVDIQVMKNEDGSNLSQVLVAWKNSANNGTLMAEAFAVEDGKLVTIGNQDMVFVEGISGNGLGYANLAVLADGTIAANWQRDTSTYDQNAFSVFKVKWGQGTSTLSIDTQQKAQEMLTRVSDAMVVKDGIRASLGALQKRLENTVTNLSIQAENLQVSESRISDTDVALEMMQFVRNQVLTQSAVAMLGQANSYPHMLATLLQG